MNDISRVTIYKLVAEKLSEELYEEIKNEKLGSIRLALTEDRVFYLSLNGGDDNDNYEGSRDLPFRTFRYAIDFLQHRVITNNYEIELLIDGDYTDEDLNSFHIIDGLKHLTITSNSSLAKINPLIVRNCDLTLQNLTIDSSKFFNIAALRVEDSKINLGSLTLQTSNDDIVNLPAFSSSNSNIYFNGDITIEILNGEQGKVGKKFILDNNTTFIVQDKSSLRINGDVEYFLAISNSSKLLHGELLETSLVGNGGRFEITRQSLLDAKGKGTLWIAGTSAGYIDDTSSFI